MEMEIVKEVEQPLLKRKRYSVELEFPGTATPTGAVVKEMIAKYLKVASDVVSIRHIYTKYGLAKAKVIVHIYNKKEDLALIEGAVKEESQKVEKKPAEEAPKSDGAPVEEKKDGKESKEE